MCFDNDDADIWQDYRCAVRRARKAHLCDECGEGIAPGDVYEQHSGVYDSRWETFNVCARCFFVRAAIAAYEIDVEGCAEDEARPGCGELRDAVANHHANYGLGVERLRDVPRW